MRVLLLVLSLLASVVGVCHDRNTSCGLWASRRYCTRGSFIHYMHRYCKLSCRLCNAPESNCGDKLSSCNHWKNSGECTKNPGFMLKMCKRSCGNCKGAWGDWGEWSACIGDCGHKKRERERACFGGKCTGSGVQQESCKDEICVNEVNKLGTSADIEARVTLKTPTAATTTTTRATTRTTTTAPISITSRKKVTATVATPAPKRKQYSTQNCGLRKINRGIPPRYRIVGGRNAENGRWPWQVGLYRSLFSKYPFCGGTLVQPNIVLTAAHCKATRFTIVKLGDTDLRREEHTERTVSVAKVIHHESFKLRKFQNDIALLILSENITLGDGINAACLPQPSTHFERCFVTGWGKVVHNGPQSTKLREIQVPLLSRRHCNRVYQNQITSRMICAGYLSGGKGACQGDSGGPLVCEAGGRFFLLGITSWGDGCGSAWRPGVYTDIRKYLHWIRDKSESDIPADLYSRPSRKYRPFILSILKLLMDSKKG